MDCPICKKDIEDKELIWHLQTIHMLNTKDILELIFEEIKLVEALQKKVKGE